MTKTTGVVSHHTSPAGQPLIDRVITCHSNSMGPRYGYTVPRDGIMVYILVCLDDAMCITDDIVSLDGGEPVKQSGNVYDGDFQSLLYHAAQLDGDRVHHIQVTNTPGRYSLIPGRYTCMLTTRNQCDILSRHRPCRHQGRPVSIQAV
jgi:hypothetical protein